MRMVLLLLFNCHFYLDNDFLRVERHLQKELALGGIFIIQIFVHEFWDECMGPELRRIRRLILIRNYEIVFFFMWWHFHKWRLNKLSFLEFDLDKGTLLVTIVQLSYCFLSYIFCFEGYIAMSLIVAFRFSQMRLFDLPILIKEIFEVVKSNIRRNSSYFQDQSLLF